MVADLAKVVDCLSRVCTCSEMRTRNAKIRWAEMDGSVSDVCFSVFSRRVLSLGESTLKDTTSFDAQSLVRLHKGILRVYAHALSMHGSQLDIYSLGEPIRAYFEGFKRFSLHWGIINGKDLLILSHDHK